jgi:hypothetical protein
MDIVNVVVAYAVLATIIPRILTKPTQINLIDNTVVYLETTRSYIINAVLFLALVLYLVQQYGPSPST